MISKEGQKALHRDNTEAVREKKPGKNECELQNQRGSGRDAEDMAQVGTLTAKEG
jgi:hypothetical protein